jgi:hypothetical protein
MQKGCAGTPFYLGVNSFLVNSQQFIQALSESCEVSESVPVELIRKILQIRQIQKWIFASASREKFKMLQMLFLL